MGTDLRETILEGLASVLKGSPDADVVAALGSGDDLDFESLDLTSLRLVELSMYLEDELGVEIDLEAFDDIGSLVGLTSLCADLVGPEHASATP